MSIGVLLVDDEPLIRSGLRAIINAEPDLSVIGEAEDGAGVTALVRRLRPDVVLMDVRMPVIDGIRTTVCQTCCSGGAPQRTGGGSCAAAGLCACSVSHVALQSS